MTMDDMRAFALNYFVWVGWIMRNGNVRRRQALEERLRGDSEKRRRRDF